MVAKHKPHKIHWHREIFLVVLALVSIGLLAYELIQKPSEEVVAYIAAADFTIACIFLLDFWHLYRKSHDKHYFIRHNWYLLLSAMPLLTGWFSALRALRFVRFTRLIVTGEHLEQSVLQNKGKL